MIIIRGEQPLLLNNLRIRYLSLGVATGLRQILQNKAVLIHSAPQPMLLATDRNDDLVDVPFVAEPTG